MRLRLILLVLSLLAVLSASTGGYLYYASLKEAAFKEAERQAQTRVEMLQINLDARLSENLRPVKALAGNVRLRRALQSPGPETLAAANSVLDHFKKTLAADVCYLMNRQGLTVASSNRNAPDSFVGHNFWFRPYFVQALAGETASYLALGTTSRKRGAYFSHAVTAGEGQEPIGVVVIKASIEQIEKQLGLGPEDIILVTSPKGVIFISNRSDWRYHLLWDLSREERNRIAESRQFGAGPWYWTGLWLKDSKYVVDQKGQRYLMHKRLIDSVPGWQIILLRSMDDISKVVSEPLANITGPLVLSLCLLVGMSVFFLYRKASLEILQRKAVQKALAESESRYRALYNRTPAMLHSIDNNGNLVSVSDFWLDVLGYDRESVLGRPLTDFFTETSRNTAKNTVFPTFFRTGCCQDIPYQFVKTDGQTIDVLLSAIVESDAEGQPVRSLAVSMDVTERNQAERALDLMREELSRYTRGLERQVEERSREINGILRYTPDVVSIKNPQGRYRLINKRFEEILGRSSDEIQGCDDTDIFPADLARQYRRNDARVLAERRSLQVEEQIPHCDGSLHSYLSVKFPLYNRDGETSAVCQVSTDITQVKRAQDQLRRLSARIIAGQEKERAAIARELHDELGQVLTALRMDAVWMSRRLAATDPNAAERALTMCRIIDKNIEDIRGMAIRLRPGVLDDLGLVDALEWYTGDLERRSEIACLFEYSAIPPISEAVATAAYRIAQEALTNAVRHASPTQCHVKLQCRNRLLRLTIFDNGCGFDPAALGESEGLGLAGMQERAILVGGKLTIRPDPRGGTRIQFQVPLDGPGGAAA